MFVEGFGRFLNLDAVHTCVRKADLVLKSSDSNCHGYRGEVSTVWLNQKVPKNANTEVIIIKSNNKNLPQDQSAEYFQSLQNPKIQY